MNDEKFDFFGPGTLKFNNFSIFVGRDFQNRFPNYETFSLKIFSDLIKENQHVVDIGANYGFFCLTAAGKYKNATVSAFEPLPDGYNILEKNIEANKFKNINLFKIAVSDKDEKRALNINEFSFTASFYENPFSKTIATRSVEAVSLDSFFGNKKVDLVKIDVEGHEISVLNGMKNIIKLNNDLKIFIEFNPKCLISAGKKPEELLKKISDLNFDIYFIKDNENKIYFLDTDFKDWHYVMENIEYSNLLCIKKGENIIFPFSSCLLLKIRKNINKLLYQCIAIAKNKCSLTSVSQCKFIKKYFRRKNKKLVMTLLARDEADIIKYNIDFHLAHGVDFIIATDNGSTDETKAILKEYEQKGVLFLIDEKEKNYQQAKWVNRMGEIAYDRYKADIIFHCDADEFWYPKSGNLKNELTQNNADILNVDIINILLEYKGGQEKFPEDTRYAVINPVIAKDYYEETRQKNLYFFRYPPKVIFKTNKKFLEVSDGNHSIVNKDNSVLESKSQDITIYHYPVRSKKNFLKKVINAGSAFAINKETPEGIHFHLKRWYSSHLAGKLDQEYRRIVLDKSEASEFILANMIEEFSFEKLLKKQL